MKETPAEYFNKKRFDYVKLKTPKMQWFHQTDLAVKEWSNDDNKNNNSDANKPSNGLRWANGPGVNRK